MTYRFPVLSTATLCVVCQVYLSGSCGQLCSTSYRFSPSPTTSFDSVFPAVRTIGAPRTAAVPATAAERNSRRDVEPDSGAVMVKPRSAGGPEESAEPRYTSAHEHR